MKNKLILAITCLFSALFLGYIFKLSDNIQKHLQILEASPNVIDIAKSIKTKILVTSDDIPLSDWSTASFESLPGKNVTIPGNDLIQDPSFKEGNFVYYNILVPKNAVKELDYLAGQLDFSLGVVFLNHFEVFLNGKFLRVSTPVSYSESRQIIPIDVAKDNLITIKAKLKTGDRGIDHRDKLLAGKSGELYSIHLDAYAGSTVFPLIFVLCKGSILFVFTLIYLLLNVGKFFEKSLLFSLCTVGEDVLAGDFLTSVFNLNTRAYLHNFFNFGSNLFLFLFLADVAGLTPKKKNVLFFFTALLVASTGIITDVLFSNIYFGFDIYLQFWNFMAVGVLIFYLPKILKVDKVLVITMATAITLSLWSALFANNVGLNLKMFGNLLLFFMVAYQSFALFRREQLELQAKQIQLVEQEKDVAIGKTASLLAHDVRRPLEQMKLILEKVASGEVSGEFLTAAKKDVDFSLTSVNNQINDIMNYSKTRPVELHEISFNRVLAGSIKQIMTINKEMEISLEYDLKAKMKVLGDESRMAGALTNLISNAVEAIRDIGQKRSGVIRLSTSAENNRFVFRIYNDGPHIPEEYLESIWKPLFTNGKENGTGLGLASVLKTIQDHKGYINVKNIIPRGVEFQIELLTGTQNDSSSDYEFKSSSLDYSYEIKPAKILNKRPLRIFLLDDDVQVHEYFQFLTQNLPFDVELAFVSRFETAREAVRSKRFDLYILDYDLGADKTGLDFYNENLSFLNSEVVIHSNREKSILENNVCGHQKKPMSYEDLLALAEKAYEKRLKVLLVDDSELTLMAWEMFHGTHNIHLVNSPEAALSFLEKGDSQVDLCIVDYYYDNSRMTGETLAQKIKNLHTNMKVILASNADLPESKLMHIQKNQFEVRSLT